MAKKKVVAKKVVKARTPSQIKADIEKLKEELKETTSLKPFTVTLEVTIKPEYYDYNESYGGTIEKIVSKECPEFASIAMNNLDLEVCRSAIIAKYGEIAVEEAESVYENGDEVY